MKPRSQPRDILLLESDHSHRRYISNYLGSHGFSVSIPDNQQELIALADRREFGLALLDASLCNKEAPTRAGWAKHFCQRNDLGVILLSTEGGSRESARALNLGADDYVSKPFHEAELLARVRAVMRRYPAANASSDNDTASEHWKINFAGRYIAAPGGTRIRLTGREVELLKLLTAKPGEAVSRDQISESLMGREWLPGDRSMDVLVRRLRSKLDAAGGRDLIKTERHVGYSLNQVQLSH